MNELSSWLRITALTRRDVRFLWVYFQVLDLCDASSEFEIRNTLQNLSQGMCQAATPKVWR